MRLQRWTSCAMGLSVAVSAGGLWLMERRYLREAAAEKTGVIEDSVEKAARDAMLVGDPLALVSYLRFLRTHEILKKPRRAATKSAYKPCYIPRTER